LAELELTAGDFTALTGRVRQFAPGPGRTVVVLEGGYDLDALRLSAGATAAALVGAAESSEPPSSGGPGREVIGAVRRARAEVEGEGV
jgi:acetoin utilization deacetylase AcuC-like enzyme